jgi:hypothetical protein
MLWEKDEGEKNSRWWEQEEEWYCPPLHVELQEEEEDQTAPQWKPCCGNYTTTLLVWATRNLVPSHLVFQFVGASTILEEERIVKFCCCDAFGLLADIHEPLKIQKNIIQYTENTTIPIIWDCVTRQCHNFFAAQQNLQRFSNKLRWIPVICGKSQQIAVNCGKLRQIAAKCGNLVIVEAQDQIWIFWEGSNSLAPFSGRLNIIMDQKWGQRPPFPPENNFSGFFLVLQVSLEICST